jgi:hypothetical protein
MGRVLRSRAEEEQRFAFLFSEVAHSSLSEKNCSFRLAMGKLTLRIYSARGLTEGEWCLSTKIVSLSEKNSMAQSL